MTLHAVVDVVWDVLDLFIGRAPAPVPRSLPPVDRERALSNGQLLLPGIAEPVPWQFNPKA